MVTYYNGGGVISNFPLYIYVDADYSLHPYRIAHYRSVIDVADDS